MEGAHYGQVVGTLAHLVLLLALGSVPMLLLNLPVGLFARATADKHMAEALAGSNVKVRGVGACREGPWFHEVNTLS